MLVATDDIRVMAEAESVQEAVREAERTRPDVVVMDIRLVDGSGIEATREIRDRLPHTKVLMLTSFDDDEALYASIMAGAAGYVLKQIKGGDLVRGIRTVGGSESLLDPAITRLVLDRLRRGKHLKMRSWRSSHRRRRRSWRWSPRAGPTIRSAPSCSWLKRPSRTTSATSSASWT